MTSKFEVAITGMSGRFPECDDVRTFRQKLYDGDTFITIDDRKWPVGYKYKFMSVPEGLGKYTNIEKFDRTVFKMNALFAVSSDILNRKILEPSFEAMIDAGVNPYTLDGENIGVFISCGINDMDNNACRDDPNVLAMIGSSKTMMSNRISFAFNFTGPSFTCYSDIFGGLEALAMGYKYVSNGTVDAAIVGTASSILDPRLSLPLSKLGVLSPDAMTRVFDASANGCGRSESTIVFYLQKLEDAKRNYGTLNFCDTFYYGLNPSTLLAYDEDYLKISLKSIYETNKSVDRMSDVAYVEMNSYAVNRLETIETNVVAELFSKNRAEPLLIGSVKSNVGHTEGASGLMAVLKALFALDSGYVAPNMHFARNNDKLVALKENMLKVVDKKMELNGNTIAVNSIGLCGSVGHASISKNSRGIEQSRKQDHLPRLLLICGRTENELINKITQIEKLAYSAEFVALSNEAFGSYMPLHIYRGYTILPKPFNAVHSAQERGERNRPIWFVFSGMGSQWNNMGKGLLDLPIFAEVVEKCAKVLRPKGIDIYEILLSDDPTIFDDIINAFVGIITVQIGLVEILNALNIKPDGIIGHSVGENACGYADGCLTLEQAVLSSYARGAASNEVETIRGMMAAIGKGYDQIKDSLPPNIAVACHNSQDNCTLTGPADDVNRFVKKLQTDGIFAKAVNVANIAYHSKYIAPAGPKLLARLKEVIPNARKRSPKWISTSVAESNWHLPAAEYCSAEYLTNNLLGAVLFEEGCKRIPDNAIVIEIAPHGLLQAILRRSLPSGCTNISLTYRSKTKENTNYLLASVGKLYIAGLEPNVNNLFEKIEYPVPCDTPAISPYCTWYHSNEYTYSEYLQHQEELGLSSEYIAISMKDDSEYSYLRHHKINNDVIITPALFVYLTWWMLSVRKNEKLGSSAIIFENVTFKRHVKISLKNSVLFSIMVHEGTGDFEVLLRNEKNDDDFKVVFSGKVYMADKKSPLDSKYHGTFEPLDRTVNKEEFYRALQEIGYHLDGDFVTLDTVSSNTTDSIATITWNDNWVIFLDSLIKFYTFSRIDSKTNATIRPKYIRRLTIDPLKFKDIGQSDTVVCHHEIQTKIVRCKGVELCDLTYETAARKKSHRKNRLTVSSLRFVSHQNPLCQNYPEFIHLCLQLAVENLGNMSDENLSTKLTLVDRTNRFTKVLTDMIDENWWLKKNISLLTKDEFKCCTLSSNDDVFFVVNSLKRFTSESYHARYNNLFLLAVLPDDEDGIDCETRNAFALVTKQAFNNLTFYLLKRKTLQTAQPLSVHVDGQDKTAVQNIGLNPSFIIRNEIEAADLCTMLSGRKENTNTKYLYVADDKMAIQRLNEENLRDQLVHDLSVAVSKNGDLGSYRNLTVRKNADDDDNAYSRHLNVTDIRMTSTEIHYVNTNRKYADDNAQNFGIEYSGIRDSNHRVMGLAWVDSNHLSSKVDEELTWTIPADWNFEEAVTVPMAYAQAFNIFTILRGIGITRSTLINMGEEKALAMACITVALRNNYSIFVTVSNEDEKIAVEHAFPTLDEHRILRVSNYHYETRVRTLTEGEGVNVVINCLRGIDHLAASLRCVSTFGLYVEIGEHNFSNVHNLELNPFLKSISFKVVKHDASTILKLPDDRKKSLHDFLTNYLRDKIIVPFSRMDFTRNCDKGAIAEESTRNVIKCCDEYSKTTLNGLTQKLRFDKNRSYIILAGKRRDNSWFELVEWLMAKGARRFIIAVENFTIGSKISHQINRLIGQKKATIVLTSSQKADNATDAARLIAETNHVGPLEAIFFVSLEMASRKIECLDAATAAAFATASSFQNSAVHFVSLFSGGLKELESRAARGLPSLVVHCEKTKRISAILDCLDEILAERRNRNNVAVLYNVSDTTSSEEYKLNVERSLSDYLPRDVYELEELGSRVTETIEFEETPSLSPKYKDTRGVYPVFVIPGLQAGQLATILRKLIYPVFCATLPQPYHSISETVTKLFESLLEIQPYGPITLISETWSAAVAFELCSLIERTSRNYRVFLLEGNPVEWTDRIRRSAANSSDFDRNLIEQIFHFYSTPSIDSSTQSVEETIELYLSRVNGEKVIVNYVGRAVEAIYNRLKMAVTFEKSAKILRNFTLFQQRYCDNFPFKLSVTSDVIVLEEENYENFLRSSKILDTIHDQSIFGWWDYGESY